MKAVIYTRVSTASQTESTSLQSQALACKEYAQQNNLEVVEIVEEQYSGGYLHDRPALSKLRDNLRAYDALIVYAIDRLSRNISHLMIVLDHCERYGVQVHFVTENLDNTPEGKLLQSVKGYVAEVEREKIRERTMRGRRSAALSGTLNHGRPLYGYLVNESGRRYIDEEKASWVRYMFEQVIQGSSLRSLATDLTNKGVPTPHGSATWWAYSVQSIILNPAYCGRTLVFRYKHKVGFRDGKKFENGSGKGDPKNLVELPGATPPIITVDEWELAQLEMQNRRKARPKKTSHEYLLRGFVQCANCGRLFSPVGKRKWRYYVCTSTQNPASNCGTKSFPAPAAEAEVWKWVVRIVMNKKYRPKSVKINDPLPAIDKQIERISGEIARIVKRSATAEDSLWDLFEKELIYKRAELRSLEEQRAKTMKLQPPKTESLDEIRARVGKDIHKFTFEQRVELLKALKLTCTWDGKNLHTAIHRL